LGKRFGRTRAKMAKFLAYRLFLSLFKMEQWKDLIFRKKNGVTENLRKQIAGEVSSQYNDVE